MSNHVVLQAATWGLFPAAIGALVFLLYFSSLKAPFVLDDLPNIPENSHIRLIDISADRLADIFCGPSSHRPAAMASFAANYYFHRYQVTGYHLTNMMIHALTAFFVLLLARQTLRLNRLEYTWTPLLAALLWLVNPIQVQAVTYIVQRMAALATLFYLISLVSYIQARRYQRSPAPRQQAKAPLFFMGCVVSGLLALASKPVAATLPLAIYFYEWFFLQQQCKIPLKKYIKWADVAIVLFLLAALLYCNGHIIDTIQATYDKAAFTLPQRLLTQPAVVIYYVSLIVYPHPDRLHLIYDFPLARGFGQPAAALIALIALAVLLMAAIYMVRKYRLLSFSLLWFLGTLTIESSFIGLAMVYEHRLYLPSVFPCIAVAGLFAGAIRKTPRKSWQAAGLVLVLVSIGCWSAWTIQRNIVWRNRANLWRDNTAKAPHIAAPYSNLGFALLHENRNHEAISVLSKALQIAPDLTKPRRNLALAYWRINDKEKALDHCRRALASAPGDTATHNMLGYLLYEQGQIKAAEQCFVRVLAKEPDSYKANMHLGMIKLEKGDYQRAKDYFTTVCQLDPACPESWYYLGRCYFQAGDMDEARQFYQRSLKISPHDPQSHHALADLLLQEKQYEAAISHYQKALSRVPALVSASINLAKARRLSGDTPQAIQTLEEALQRCPGNPALLLSLGMLHAETGHLAAAAGYLEYLSVHMPDNASIYYNLTCLYARMNKVDPAVSSLKRAIHNGYDHWGHLESDKDLENIRDTDYYKKITEKG
ncbi:MAG: tetratricopeptide repeat protein [Desulfosudaceae bacterium]